MAIQIVQTVKEGLSFHRLLKEVFEVARKTATRRKAQQTLARLTPRELRDIGLSPNDLVRFDAVSPHEDLTALIRELRHERSGNW